METSLVKLSKIQLWQIAQKLGTKMPKDANKEEIINEINKYEDADISKLIDSVSLKSFKSAKTEKSKCNPPEKMCEDGFLCDLRSGECVNRMPRGEEDIAQFQYNGKKIFGNIDAIEKLKEKIEKSKCNPPEKMCEDGFLCDIRSGDCVKRLPRGEEDIAQFEYNGKKIFGNVDAIEELKRRLFPEPDVSLPIFEQPTCDPPDLLCETDEYPFCDYDTKKCVSTPRKGDDIAIIDFGNSKIFGKRDDMKRFADFLRRENTGAGEFKTNEEILDETFGRDDILIDDTTIKPPYGADVEEVIEPKDIGDLLDEMNAPYPEGLGNLNEIQNEILKCLGLISV
jgi:hypothetical protein